MSEMAPEAGGDGGNFLTRKIMGIPVIVLAGVALIGIYLVYRHYSSSGGAASSSAGAGTATGGTTTVDSGAVQVTVNTASGQDVDASGTTGGGSTTITPPTGGGGTTTTSSTVTVPSVVGLEKRNAGPNIQAVGLKPKFSSKKQGTISAQSPAAGTKVPKGSVDALTVKPK